MRRWRPERKKIEKRISLELGRNPLDGQKGDQNKLRLAPEEKHPARWWVAGKSAPWTVPMSDHSGGIRIKKKKESTR